MYFGENNLTKLKTVSDKKLFEQVRNLGYLGFSIREIKMSI